MCCLQFADSSDAQEPGAHADGRPAREEQGLLQLPAQMTKAIPVEAAQRHAQRRQRVKRTRVGATILNQIYTTYIYMHVICLERYTKV